MAKSGAKQIKELLSVFTSPIVVGDTNWAGMIPQWLRERITIDRLMEVSLARKEEREPTATDAEALAYLIPVSMIAPMEYNIHIIYLYLGRLIMKDRIKELPEDVFNVYELDSMQTTILKELKQKIYKKQIKRK